MSGKRVVVTGYGPVSAVGIGHEPFAQALVEGRSGIGPIEGFTPLSGSPRFAAQLHGFTANDYLASPKAYLDRAAEIAFAAMHLALEDAGLDPAAMDRNGVGLVLGSAWGSLASTAFFLDDLLKKGPRLVKPFVFPHTYANTPISLLAIEYGLGGYHLHLASGGISSALALLDAADWVRSGRGAVALAGGFEALNGVLLAACTAAGGLAPGAPAGLPFGRGRAGCVLGEGGAILVLEELEHARRREAVILGELAGGATGAGLDRVMRTALDNAGVARPDALLAAANGSAAGDAEEAAAIHRVPALADVPVTTVKPLLGETLGAAGALQLAAALAMLERDHLPAIAGLVDPDEAAHSLRLVRSSSPAAELDTILLNTTDPGGGTVSLVLKSGREFE